MTRKLIIRDRATQDLRQQANYILINGTTAAAEHYLEMAEKTFMQLIQRQESESLWTLYPIEWVR